jgi:hypothetical protein
LIRLLSIALCAVILPISVAAAETADKVPTVAVSASVTTQSGQPRVFWGPQGRTEWSPCLPAYVGDKITLVFSTSSGDVSRVWVKMDDVSLADLTKSPWKVTVDTSSLAVGKHVASGNIRFSGKPMRYGVAKLEFFVQKPPEEVKGSVEEYGVAPTGANPSTVAVPAPGFVLPTPAQIDQNLAVTVRSRDVDADRQLRAGGPIHINKPISFCVDVSSGLDRWAYQLRRNDRQIAGAGPMKPYSYLEVAPKKDDEPGILPGNVTLRVWGVKSTGVYSKPTEVQLVIE